MAEHVAGLEVKITFEDPRALGEWLGDRSSRHQAEILAGFAHRLRELPDRDAERQLSAIVACLDSPDFAAVQSLVNELADLIRERQVLKDQLRRLDGEVGRV